MASCADDDDSSTTPPGSIDKTEIFVERLTELLGNVTTLLNDAVFGEKQGEYPVRSKRILEDQITSLDETLSKVKEGTKKISA